MKQFWSWIGTAVLHGIIICAICLGGYDAAYGHNRVNSIGLNEQSTLVFTVVIHVVFYKLFLELEGRSVLALVFVAVTLLAY